MFYKVVNNDLTSSVLTQYSVQYHVGFFVKPALEHSKLFVFNDKNRAIEHCRIFVPQGKVFECEVTNPERILSIPNVYSEVLPLYWKERNYYLYICGPAPPGTVIVDKVKLTKKVWDNAPL